uniref:Uncharacterized protein LOC111118599 n=1 Tax=Crassostrea virginica TaxID=6565 RepID=A0A8B8CDU6_CRAVI|nr:uncharacterized protein LOC111118599 [Crassostrea virginica]
MTQMNSEDTFIRKTNYDITDLVGNFVLRTSNQTNASSGYSAIISPVPEPEPPADYEMPQISRQSGRGGLGYNIYDNRLSKYNRRTGPGHYDNEGYLNLGNSKQSNASSGSFASVSPVNQGASQGNPNQLNFTGAAAYYPGYLRKPCSPSKPPQLPPARIPVHVPIGDQKLKQKRCAKKKLCYYIFVIVIFLGISLTVAFSTMNRQKSDEMESLVNAFPGKLQGQDEQLTNINHTVLKTVTTFENALRFEVDKFQIDSHDEMLETMKNMSKDLNTELTEKITETKKNMSDDLKTELADKMTETKKNMSDDLKTELADKMTETKRNMSKDLKTELTNKMMETKRNMSEDLKTELTNKMMETKKNMSEELADKMTETKKNMSEDFKTELTNKMTETKKNMSEDLKTELTNKMTETKKNMSEDFKREIADKMTETKKNMSEDLKTEITNKMTETKKNMSEDLKTELADKMTETKKNMSDDLKTELADKLTETKKNMSEDLKTELTDIMMEAMQLMFEDVKTELTEYINKTFSHRIDQGGEPCNHVTMGDCVADCYNICNGDFQSCNTCTGFITCTNHNLYNRPCFGNLVWDDTTKTCEATSNTCNIHVQGTTT